MFGPARSRHEIDQTGTVEGILIADYLHHSSPLVGQDYYEARPHDEPMQAGHEWARYPNQLTVIIQQIVNTPPAGWEAAQSVLWIDHGLA
jgi:hypothetical protein